MQRPSSRPSASSPRPRAVDTGFGIPRALPPHHLDQAAARIRPLLLPEAPNDYPVMAGTVTWMVAEVAAAERAGFAAVAYRQQLQRLQQILERYEWQVWRSQDRRSRAQRLFWELREIAEEERRGQRVMSAANYEFGRIATSPSWYNN